LLEEEKISRKRLDEVLGHDEEIDKLKKIIK
jgi:hypothetical protein